MGRGANQKFKSSSESFAGRSQGEAGGGLRDTGADHPPADHCGAGESSAGARRHQRIDPVTARLQNKQEGCERLLQRDHTALKTSANPTVRRDGPNPHWLARAQLFELPGKLCKRGHDLSKEGVYTCTRQGKKRPTKSCRRCRIEDVQNWRDRTEWAA